ncbi:Histone transcription regulator 3 [Cladophialophora chaetospira]|uniref:Histone transcription regulator 3 homolog n=1 Tax=Cladophialophora chaetospira TaxID=386627 RepID=A0AA38XBT7_9EURO|nr:Histone transcription regulator 3 [Cladophialophora chaetospira]
MSGFTALNVEPEVNLEDDIDDTREIQLEEAFKLYQNALKLHSQGPQYYADAQDAYDELLKSEVFKYPEVVSEFGHDELDEVPAAAQASEPLDLLPSNAAESSASSVPQLIYLAFKNRGQFLLDAARHELTASPNDRAELCRYYAQSSKESLRQFSQALERDDTDLDLWKKAARVADVLSSQRISRFCLESVLAGEDEDGQQTIDISGLDEAFAAGELEEVVDLVQDDLSRLQSSDARPKSKLLAALRKSNDPYPYLPKRAERRVSIEYLDDKYRPLSFGVAREDLTPNSMDLFALGEKIAETIGKVQRGEGSQTCATTVKVVLPSSELVDTDIEMALAAEDAPDVVRSHQTTNGVMHDPVPAQATSIGQVDSSAKADGTNDQGQASSGSSRQPNGDRRDLALDGDTIEVRSAAPILPDSTSLPSRKRSSTVAGNDEPEGRAKSKRLRARESLADLAAQEEETAHEQPQYFFDQLAIYEQTDQAMLDVVNSMLAKFDIKMYLSMEEAKQSFWMDSDNIARSQSDASKVDMLLLADLRHGLVNWTEEKGQAVLHGHSSQDFPEKAAGVSQFLQRAKPATPKKIRLPEKASLVALSSLVSYINAQPTNIYDAAVNWLYAVLTTCRVKGRSYSSPYLLETWSTEMKYMVATLACDIEDHLWESMRRRLSSLAEASQENQNGNEVEMQTAFELVEGLFEIFLDTTATVSDPNSALDPTLGRLNAERLQRWASMAGDFMQLYLNCCAIGMSDPLVLRFVWASITHARLDDTIDKAHVVLLLEELKRFLENSEAEPVHLPNNSAMPEISITAIEHQLSVLSTSDFFARVFDDDNSDPVAVIEMLEPMLDSIVRKSDDSSSSLGIPPVCTPQVEELVKFLEANSATLTLALWRRLQNAYLSINYQPQVVSCLLRIIETIVGELHTPRHLDLDATSRSVEMLKWLHDLDEVILRLLSKIPDEPAPFECIDDAHLRSSVTAITQVLKLLYGFVVYDDSVKVGQTAPPLLKGALSTKQYEKSRERLREMFVRASNLYYLLLKEVTVQDPSSYPRAADDLAEYLCTVHNSLGVRHYCKYGNKSFVKLVKKELSNLPTEQDYAAEMAQVFYDLYQLRFASGIGDYEHGCPPENLDRKTAWTLIPTIMKYAERFNVKDLNRSELKGTIERMQQALGVVKSPPTLKQNQLIIRDYLKGIIKTNDLFDCIKGVLALPTVPVKADTEVAARSGWYFMLGHLTLSKYKSVKRVSPTSTEELDSAMALFRQDLHHDAEKWETWYRLAQCYEAKIEDDLIWNSAKLNDSRADIALLERQAIHSYMMATAIAFRTPDDQLETAAKIEDMLGEFATRLYASSRPPLDMEAFRTDKHVRHLSSTTDQTMSKQPYYPPVRQFTLWGFAARLLSIKLTNRPKPWTSHYSRAKCLWKIFQDPYNRGRVSTEQVIKAIVEAIEALPKKEKTNEPILEPHLKLVSVVHKMLRAGKITHQQAHQHMGATRYAQGVNLSQDEDGVDWERYMIDILKKLSHADKANWHHRITNRAAHVLYDESPNLAGALGAKHEFTQQIFTKTMTMQVWKPENERPGRHYVYTGRYVVFFVHVLEQLNDRGSLDSLVRRIRRKTTDFLDHTKIWEDAATTYVRLLRRHGQIPEGRERSLFDGMNHEEFTKKSEAMEQWSHDPDTTSVYLDVMREGIELKRLNNSLMKGPIIDDLIGDAYACLYDEFIKQLPPEEQPKPQPAPLPQGTFINMTTDAAGGETEEAQRARVNDMLRAQGDGIADGPLSLSISASIGLGLQNPPTQLPGMSGSGQPTPEVQRERAKPGRTKTVTRREIQRKAESAIVKPPPIKTPILSKRPTIEVSLSAEAGSPINRRLAETKEQDADDSRATSRRGSVQEQDSADGDADGEDSELSDLDDRFDEVEQKRWGTKFEETAKADREGDDSDDEGEGDADDDGDIDEEMQDANEVEIQDSQDVANERLQEDKESPDEEFHDAMD